MRAKRAGKKLKLKCRERTCYNLMRAKRAGKIVKLNCREQSEGKILHFPPNSSKLRPDYIFSFQKRTNYLFPTFSRSEYLFPKSAIPPPPSESNGRPLREGGRGEGKSCRMKKRKSKLRGRFIDSGTWNTALAFDMTNAIFLLSESIFRFTPFARF